MPLAGWMLVKEKELGFEWVIFAGFVERSATPWVAGGLLCRRYWAGAVWSSATGATSSSHITISISQTVSLRAGAMGGLLCPPYARRAYLCQRSGRGFPDELGEVHLVSPSRGRLSGRSVLAAGGYILGENWEDIRDWMRPADYPSSFILVVLSGLVYLRGTSAVHGRNRDQPDLRPEARQIGGGWPAA